MGRGDRDGALTAFERSVALARELVRRHPDDGDRLFELGQSEFWVGYAHLVADNLDGAERHFAAYFDISWQLATADPQRRDWRLELGYAHSNLGTLARRRDDHDRAARHYRDALTVMQSLA
ncbi:MAG: tetratricopeptide repeat protein, partial [Myxococcota bacterium]